MLPITRHTVVQQMISLPWREQIALLREWLQTIGTDRARLEQVCVLVAQQSLGSREDKIARWLEKRLTKDPTLTPKRLAYECRYYLRMPAMMTPYLIGKARRVKKRLWMRQRRGMSASIITGSTTDTPFSRA